MRLDETQLDRFKRLLEHELEAISKELEGAQAGSATVTLDQTSVGRLSRMDALQQQAMSTGLQERLAWRCKRAQAALERVLDGKYGICCVCEDEMALERLEADPSAPFCADCQGTIDVRRRER